MENKKQQNKTKKLLLIAMMSVGVLVMSGCTTLNNFTDAFFGTGQGDTIKIGVYQPMTGVDKEEGEKEIRGIQIAHEIRPEILGNEIELLEVDTGSNLEIAESSLEENIPKSPVAFLGSYGSAFSLLGAEYFDNAQIPAIAISNQNAYVTKGNEYYFRISAVETRQTQAIADFVVNDLKKTQVAILRQDKDDVGEVNASLFTRSMTEYSSGTSNTVDFRYLSSETDYIKYFESIEEYGIDTIYLQANPQTARAIIKQADDNAYRFNFIGSVSWDNEDFFEDLKVSSSGIYFPDMTADVDETAPYYEDFIAAYERAYPDEEGDIPIETYMAFDAYMLLLDAIERAEDYVDGEKLKESISATSSYHGISRIYNFDIQGDAMVDVKIMQIADGTATQVYFSKGGTPVPILITDDEEIDDSSDESDEEDSNDSEEEDEE